jgi:hypothetical protein
VTRNRTMRERRKIMSAAITDSLLCENEMRFQSKGKFISVLCH